MTEAHEAVVKILAIGVALLGLWFVSRSTTEARRRRVVLAGLTTLGALSYVNFGAFHTDGTPLHIWDQFHYVVGSKYFPELGYDGLYVATVAAFEEKDPAYPAPKRMRDLRTGAIVPGARLDDFKHEIRARFTNERWNSFRSDATHFYIRPEIFLDNGYLGTPADVAIERMFTAHLPFRQATALLFAALDIFLLGVGGWVVYSVFGLEILAAVSLILGLGYCSRFYWVGGAFLRYDWIIALMVCAAALQRRRGGIAGAALAYAICTRVYPVLMLLPLGAYAFAHRRTTLRLPVRQFAWGLVIAAVVLLAAGCLVGRGPGVWLESAQRLLEHGSVVAPNAIGLRIPLSASPANLRGDLLDPETLYAYDDISRDFALTAHEHLVWIILATAGVLTLALRAAWKTEDVVAAFVSGVVVMYALTTPMGYYGTYFLLLGLVRPIRSACVFLICNVFMFVTAGAVLMLSNHGVIRLNGAAVYVPVSVLLIVMCIDWLLHVPGLRIRTGGAVAPERTPATG
jgi:hypothetical protein